MIVQELIDLLSSLTEEQKTYGVDCTYDGDYATTVISGIHEITGADDDTILYYVTLQGEK